MVTQALATIIIETFFSEVGRNQNDSMVKKALQVSFDMGEHRLGGVPTTRFLDVMVYGGGHQVGVYFRHRWTSVDPPGGREVTAWERLTFSAFDRPADSHDLSVLLRAYSDRIVDTSGDHWFTVTDFPNVNFTVT